VRRYDNDGVYAVILVGGAGKRLRPLSTDERPKAFISVTRDRETMFAQTLKRIRKIVPGRNVLVAANKKHVGLVKKDFPEILNVNLIREPVSRNTAPAIFAAASVLKRVKNTAIMVVVSADQYIKDEAGYLDAIRRGIDFVKSDHHAIVVIGVRPDFPSTQFGYIKRASSPLPAGIKVSGIYKAEKFVEKPELELAKKYMKSGRYLWNSGIFIFGATAILKEIEICAPAVTRAFNGAGPLAKIYKKTPNISIDYAVMERSKNVYCVRGDYRWQDMGSFDSLKVILKREGRKFIEEDAKIVRILP
jgi:mannose-1-phosphate guanylyltransferase